MKEPFPIGGFLKRTWVYFSLYGLWLLLAGVLLAVMDRWELHITLNGLNYYGGDRFYWYATYLGDRRVAWLVGVLLCFRQVRLGAAILVAAIGAGLLTELLKYQVFGPVPRPVAYFGEPSPLYLVPGFENKLAYSMPSGHAAIAFALYTSIAMHVRARWVQVGLVAAALCAAYSRVFLSEHFLDDIVAGSILGVSCALVARGLLRPPVPLEVPAGDEPEAA